MSSLIYIECKESTETSPIAFFESFYTLNKIKEAKESYISMIPKPVNKENPYDPNDFWNSFSFDVDEKKKTFTVKYYEEEYDDEGLVVNLLSKINLHSFESELEKLFREQFYISTRLLRNKIEKFNKDELSKKSVLEYLSDKTRFFLKAIDDIKTNVKPEKLNKVYTRPYKSLIVFFYRHYDYLMPSQHSDKRISVILKELPKNIELYKPVTLSVDIIDAIINLKKTNKYNVFPFSDPKLVHKNLSYFFNKQFDLIKPPICFPSNIVAANYLIAKLAFYLGYTRPEIQKANIFKLDTNNFNADLCNKDYSRFGSNNITLKYLIDSMFYKHLS